MSMVDISELLLQLGLSSSVTDEERAVSLAALTSAEGAVKRFLRYDPELKLRTEYYPRQDRNIGNAQGIWEVSATEAYVRQESGAVTSELQVQHIPVRSTPAIDLRIDYDGKSGARAGSFAAATQKTEGTDFWPNYDIEDSDGNSVCRDGVLRSVGLWPSSAGCVKVVYTAGYTPEELYGQDDIIDASPIVEAIVDEARRRVEKMFIRKKSALSGFVAGPKSSESLGSYSYSVDSSLASKLYGDTKDLTDATMQRLQDYINYGWDI